MKNKVYNFKPGWRKERDLWFKKNGNMNITFTENLSKATRKHIDLWMSICKDKEN